MKRSYSGPEAGMGAVYEWDSDGKAGKGRMQILESQAPGRLLIRLDFIKPIEGHNQATFLFQPSGAATRVSWIMDGQSPYIAKLLGLFFNMDKMIGRDFEAGLANLKGVSER
jgi:hypothetical protein